MAGDYLYNLATDKYQGLFAAVLKFFLLVLSWIYGSAVKILTLFRRIRPYRLNCKVISVGNITLGGTGKTSLVEYIARYLKEHGRKVAILSRGYGRRYTVYGIRYTDDGIRTTGDGIMGDEPYMLLKNLGDVPVLADPDRIKIAKQAVKDYGVDTVILDDAFQQWQIKKDLEIVTIDVTNPFGNKRLIPRGILREPLSALKRADVFILTKTNLNPAAGKIKDFLQKLNPSAAIFLSAHKPLGFYNVNKPDELLNLDLLRGKSVTVFSGIGDPDSFENLLRNLGINIGLSFRFGDHHNYNKGDLGRIIKASKDKNIDTIVTTEKDAARLYDLRLTTYDLRLLILRIKLTITEDEQRFQNRLLGLYLP